MCWYIWKFWRIAYGGGNRGIMSDADGIWKHFIFGIFLNVSKNK